MSKLIKDLEDILKKHVDDDSDEIDLSDDDCTYRKFYFDFLPQEAAQEALLLFPSGDRLYQKYLEIIKGSQGPVCIEDSELSSLVYEYLKSTVLIMDPTEDDQAIRFIKSIDKVCVADGLETFGPGENALHKFAYGAISEFLLEELPDDDALWLLYDWSLEKTKWATVSAYFLQDFIETASVKGNDLFRPAFQLWLSRNSNRYWAEGNSLDSNKAFCKASITQS